MAKNNIVACILTQLAENETNFALGMLLNRAWHATVPPQLMQVCPIKAACRVSAPHIDAHVVRMLVVVRAGSSGTFST